MAVGEYGNRSLRDKGVVISQYSRRPYHILQRRTGNVVADVSDEIHRSSKNRLSAESGVVGIEPPVFKDADVMHAAVGFNEVVRCIEYIISVNVDRHTVLAGLRKAMGIHADSVVEVGYVVVTDHVALPVYFHCIVGRQRRRILKSIPSDERVGIVSSDHDIVADIEVFGIDAMCHDCDAHVFDPAVLYSQPTGAHHAFEPCVKRYFRVADGEPFKEVVVGSHHVKESVGAVTVEDYLTVTGSFYCDGF